MYPDVKSVRVDMPHDPDFISVPRTELMMVLADDAMNKNRVAVTENSLRVLGEEIEKVKAGWADATKAHETEMEAVRGERDEFGASLARANDMIASANYATAMVDDACRRMRRENDDLNRRNESLSQEAERLRAEVRSLKRKRR